MEQYYFAQQLINGITIGSVYGLIAIGYTMVYGIIGMINFAHGEIYMIGAFISLTCFILLSLLGITFLPLVLLLALVVTIFFTSFFGWSVERMAYRPLRSSTRLGSVDYSNWCIYLFTKLCADYTGCAFKIDAASY